MINVIIERKIVKGMESTYEMEVKRSLRGVMGANGFISGTSYIDINDSTIRTIITTWGNVASWEKWYGSELRRTSNYNLNQLLEQKETIKILKIQSLS